jgi:hypothetical protein
MDYSRKMKWKYIASLIIVEEHLMHKSFVFYYVLFIE